MNRRRRQQSSPFSLFSFQDIMTSIMGILVLITLIMALDLTQAAVTSDSSTISSTESAGTPDNLQHEAELNQLARRQAELQVEYDRLASSLTRQAKVFGSESELVTKAQESLAQMYERIERLNEQVRERKARINTGSDQQRHEQLLAHVVAIEQKSAQLAASIDEQRRNPTLTYILQAGSDKRPLLIELSDDEITIGAADASQSPIRLRADNRTLRTTQLQQILKTHNRNEEYIVILLKPSAFGVTYYQTYDAVTGAGFSVGLELIPESLSVFGLAEGG